MHTLKVTLKQHTPLIHFQHDQDGATLRASEVKPKLDRYILSKLTPEERTNGVKDGWIKEKNGKVWLDYKMRVEAETRNRNVCLEVESRDDRKRGTTIYKTSKINNEEFPFLLANMGGKENESELANLSFYNRVYLIFSVQFDELFDRINSVIEAFFALHNFGQRKDKGFGCFIVIEITRDDNPPQPCNWTPTKFLPNGSPVLEFSLGNKENLDLYMSLFKVLDFYWKCLKSGVNYTRRFIRNGNVKVKYRERYVKPYLYQYLNEKGYTWEKRLVKQSFNLETTIPARTIAPNKNRVVFGRAILGCPDKFEYRIPTGESFFDKKNKEKERERINEQLVLVKNQKVRENQDLIERISSPIVFKPILEGNGNVRVYVLFDDSAIVKLKEKQSDELSFTISNNEKTAQLSLDPNVIDPLDLINKYHDYIGTNSEMVASLFGRYDDQKHWISGQVSESTKWRMIPRDFNWNNILGGNNMVILNKL